MEFIDIGKAPDLIAVQRERIWSPLACGGDAWRHEDVAVKLTPEGSGIALSLSAGERPVSRLVLRWRQKIGEHARILGDHWERGYGDLGWYPIVPDKVLPWYFLSSDGRRTDGYGVKTMPSSMCGWQVDTNCITLIVDVRCGGCGVVLSGRVLEAACTVCRRGQEGESAFEAARRFCRMMCASPMLPRSPVYGGNNWYSAYGKSSASAILADSSLISELAGGAENRPFMVIDAGWHSDTGEWRRNSSEPWADGTRDFPDMALLAARMKELGVRPGLWFRPLLTSNLLPKEWLLKTRRVFSQNTDGLILDPSIPEVLDTISGYMRRFAQWGYELVKHDFTSYDILGRWGFSCDTVLTEGGWHFADRSKTTAEVVAGLYRALRRGAPDSTILGCNSFSHLSAGVFEICRVGDDTSGQQWERTRKMGVNSLAFRLPQHDAFYAVDADCVALTPHVSWALSRQFLDLVANSGTVLMISAVPKAMGEEQRKAVARAFSVASRARPVAQPLDWMDNTTPSRWLAGGESKEYDWVDTSMLQNCSGALYEEI